MGGCNGCGSHMTHGVTDRQVERKKQASASSSGPRIRCERCGGLFSGADASETELVWTRHLARFGLSEAAEPLLERKDWSA